MRRLYNWVTGHVPDKVLHLAVCFIVSLGSWEVAVGLAVGRESGILHILKGTVIVFWICFLTG